MVVKTELCAFSEFRIYPGHGSTFIRRDGQPMKFITAKATSLYHQRKKPAKIVWTQAWRRLNKKGQKDEHTRARKRKVQKFTRAVVGISADELKMKKTQKPEFRAAAREAALREIKQRQKAAKANKVKSNSAKSAPKAAKTVKKGGKKN